MVATASGRNGPSAARPAEGDPRAVSEPVPTPNPKEKVESATPVWDPQRRRDSVTWSSAHVSLESLHAYTVPRKEAPCLFKALGWVSFRDNFCKLLRGRFAFKMNAANIETDDYKTMSKTSTQIFNDEKCINVN